ncbi:uncharacterized protein LOC111372160 isoform X2 [Olea europaea var. sylvestris]|uniref:uncharacterized protein LOC111372160 isoform X2 n=1 Tax=Olea europaea var. sylvestris TaxID=158386 RepID=UPI000C1D55E7|nr:uncharacterized protein LOC111372160 isoform X2 [Olea europaea var. sylvestris]
MADNLYYTKYRDYWWVNFSFPIRDDQHSPFDWALCSYLQMSSGAIGSNTNLMRQKLCRLNEKFFSHLKGELGKLRFAMSKTQEMVDRLIELEALQKALQEGTEAYDKLQDELVNARKNLMKILTSDNVKILYWKWFSRMS